MFRKCHGRRGREALVAIGPSGGGSLHGAGCPGRALGCALTDPI